MKIFLEDSVTICHVRTFSGGFGYDLSSEDIFWRILLLLILSGEDLSEDSVTICQVRTSLGDSFGYY